MEDAQPGQALCWFRRRAWPSRCRHEGPGQGALLKSLAQAVAEFLGPFGQIPLGMADRAGVIIEDAQQSRIDPLALSSKHAQGAVMKIQVPEPVDILAFVTADLAGSHSDARRLGLPDCGPDRGEGA